MLPQGQPIRALLRWPVGMPPHSPTDLIGLSPDVGVSKPTSTFAEHVYDLHAKIHRKIAMSNNCYELSINVRRKDISV